MRITATEFILYVADQARSTAFYRSLLGCEPILNVPGMTEFSLGHGTKLGLMPEQGIARIISGPMPHPSQGMVCHGASCTSWWRIWTAPCIRPFWPVPWWWIPLPTAIGATGWPTSRIRKDMWWRWLL